MRKFLLLLFCLALFYCAPSEALACSCAPDILRTGETEDQRIDAARREAQAVFSGTVLKIKIRKPSQGDRNPPVEVTFKVLSVWKGIKTEKAIVLTENDFSGGCCKNFEVGKSYLVYAYDWNDIGGLGTNQCTRTKEMSDAERDLRVLGEGKAPKRAKR